MPLEKVARVLARCHVGICLLKETDAMRKALPAKTFDFMGAGLPMIVSPGGELLELVAKEGMGIGFQKNDAPKIAQSIVDLSQGRDQLETLRGNVLRARTRYGRDKQAKGLLENNKRVHFLMSRKSDWNLSKGSKVLSSFCIASGVAFLVPTHFFTPKARPWSKSENCL